MNSEEKGSLEYIRELLAMPINELRDLTGIAWVFLYLVVVFILLATMINKIPEVEITRVIDGVAIFTLLGCLGVAIKTNPNLKTWSSLGRAELLGIISAFGLVVTLVSTV